MKFAIPQPRTAPWFASVMLLLLAAGCAVNPVSGGPEVVFSSREDEMKAGKQASEQVAQQLGLVADSARTRYVEELGASLAVHSPRQDIPYEFHIIDMKEPNAFALPGGYVYVSRGLMLLANDEDALAGAIGHEIGHAAARHAVQRQTRAAPLAILSGVTSGVVGIVSPGLGRGVGAVTGLANSAVLAPYGRNQEREADKVGQEIAAQSGYAPDGISDLLESLGREQALHEDRAQGGSFLSTHPSSAERVATTRTHAADLKRSDAATLSPTQAAFYERLDGLVVGDRAAGGVFVDETLFLQPDMNFRIQFPPTWETRNGNDYVGAISKSEEGAVILQVAKSASDPVTLGRAFMAEAGLKLGEPKKIRVNGLDAARVKGTQNGRGIVLTWIAHGESMYQIISVCPEKRLIVYEPLFVAAADSFAPLKAADWERIREDRVRIFTAGEGESLADVVARVDGQGKLEFIAVVNGVDPNAPLQPGQLLKIPVSELYQAGD